jgi:HD-GYP domain-containing protein (c-di-GMP phosphodiesterase class II)
MLISVAVFLLPILVAIAAAAAFARIVPDPRSGAGVFGWWALLLAVPWIVYILASRLGRRALPLAALLNMTLVFPDKAPSRMAVARKAGTTRGLERQLEAARGNGVQDEPAVAAAQILALAASLNKHDRLTRGHSERVRVVTDLIADQLNLPQADRDRLRWSALLHDIGKLTVAGSILNKAGKPDEMEWQILQGHPLEGARLAAPLAGWLGPWADTIVQHHEKYDGTGYPFGLSGDQISLGGRIVAVADCYETMTAVRSYKSAMTAEAARQELAACAGRHFDPVIVRAFLEASVGRSRVLGGALSWLGELPLINGLPRLGQLAAATGQVFAGAVAVLGISVAGAAGAHHLPSHASSQAATLAPGSKAQANPLPVTPNVPPPGPSAPSIPTGLTPRVDVNPTAPTVPPTAGGSGATTPFAAPEPAPLTPSSLLTAATAPSAPSDITGVAGDAGATLSWTAPTSDGGEPVTGYVVTPYVDDVAQGTAAFNAALTTETIGSLAQGTSTFNSAATTETINGLTDGTAYSFTVAAVNAVGASLPSAPSNPLTPAAVPSVPTGVNGVAGDGQVTLSWTAPSFDGGESVSGYVVTPYIGVFAQGTTTFNSALTTETVGGLTDGTAYTFTVTALNAVGSSVPSLASGALTPAAVPSVPTGVNGVAGDAEVTLSWTAPAFDGGESVSGYVVTPYIGVFAQGTTTSTRPSPPRPSAA